MLSIEKMDLDSGGMDAMDEMHVDTQVINSLELIPVVYTTRLDDMEVLKHPTGLDPKEVTDRILKESKPKLFDYSSTTTSDHGRCNKKSFSVIKAKLNKIYKNINNLNEELDIKPDIFNLQIDPMVIKEKVSDGVNTTCEYSELLKLCKPFSIVLSKVIELPGSKSKVMNNVKELLRTQENDLVTVISSSDEDDEPLITLNRAPRIPINNEPNVHNSVMSKKKVTTVRTILNVNKAGITLPLKEKKHPKGAFLNFTGNRLLLNGLMEMHDLYSKEFYSFFTDSQGLLIDYYKDKIENASKYEHIHSLTEARFTFLNCCWVQRDEYIQSMYPKMLMYTNFRFMRKQHMCPLGACVCCCRTKEEITKPSLIFTHTDDSVSENPPPYLKEDIEIQALEDEIEKSIICMNKAPRINTTEWLRTLLSKSSPGRGRVSLIEKALHYEKPLPTKQTVNRHVLTIKEESPRPNVLIFRNFATDVRDVYELNSNGELQSYVKLTCFSNTNRPDIKKLTLSPKSVKDVCCWFKREEIITELLDSKSLHTSAAKFIRSRHMCMAETCTCCCKPTIKKAVVLTDVKIPPRPDYWPVVQKFVKLNTPQSDNVDVDFLPLVSDTGVSKIFRSGLNNLNDPVASSSTAASANDNDCKITSVSQAPRVLPATSNLLPPEQIKYIANMVSGDEMSGEVNTLITSILERFKDVRLTINSDGKVAAALNTPINTLTTVELKVLANILAYAQSQINLLGLNSGMSLSSIINMKKDDPNGVTINNPQNSTMQPRNVTKESHSDTYSTKALGNPKEFPQLNRPFTKEAAYEFFTKSLSVRNQGFNDSFTSFLATKLNSPETQNTVTPVIQNVFTLKKEDIDETKDNTSSTTLWYRKPANQQTESTVDISKTSGNTKKRTQENTATASMKSKRIRVVSPSKLSAPVTNDRKEFANTFYKPMPLLNTHTLEVGSLIPGVPLLCNPNFRVVVNPIAQPSGVNAVVISTSEPAVPTASGSERTLVVTPLTTMAAIGSNENQVTVPVSVSHSVAAVTSVGAFTIPEEPPDTPVDGDDDDYCILGM